MTEPTRTSWECVRCNAVNAPWREQCGCEKVPKPLTGDISEVVESRYAAQFAAKFDAEAEPPEPEEKSSPDFVSADAKFTQGVPCRACGRLL